MRFAGEFIEWEGSFSETRPSFVSKKKERKNKTWWRKYGAKKKVVTDQRGFFFIVFTILLHNFACDLISQLRRRLCKAAIVFRISWKSARCKQRTWLGPQKPCFDFSFAFRPCPFRRWTTLQSSRTLSVEPVCGWSPCEMSLILVSPLLWESRRRFDRNSSIRELCKCWSGQRYLIVCIDKLLFVLITCLYILIWCCTEQPLHCPALLFHRQRRLSKPLRSWRQTLSRI